MKKVNEFNDFALSKAEMINVLGGARYRCTCYNSTGSWTGNYGSQADAVAQGGQWCATGIAECSPVPQA
jgi:natural product precursor